MHDTDKLALIDISCIITIFHEHQIAMHNLLVVESPSKSKTLERYLKGVPDTTYTILATGGHIYDVASKPGQVDIENGFRMNYQVIQTKKKFVDAIAKSMKRSDALYLATDPDREGEAISAHVHEELIKRKALQGKPVYRVAFSEVTKSAVQNALNHPREISKDLVEAQHARAALDYLVGFNLSPVLWKKISNKSRSAGRVQSPALRMIVERQRQIEAFRAQEYWSIESDLMAGSAFMATLTHFDGHKLKDKEIGDDSRAHQIVSQIEQALDRAASNQRQLVVQGIDKKTVSRNPAAPFNTSGLVQAASGRLNMQAQTVMSTAQQLYEGVAINGEHTGLITYLRTDSFHMAESALTQIRAFVSKEFGDDALPDKPRRYKTKSRNAQEAHEAIRPTDAFLTPQSIRSQLTTDQFRLYEMIWKRTIASQMLPALYDKTSVDLGIESHVFTATGSTLKSPGFKVVYGVNAAGASDAGEDGGASHDDDEERTIPPLEEGQQVKVEAIRSEQHFTKPPARYNQALLVKELEKNGIGRPSTYASIITKLLQREYVVLQKRAFYATHLGCVVSDYLVEHFNNYVDYEFTAHLEERLDDIAGGELRGGHVLETFWRDFNGSVQETLESGARYERKLGVDTDSGRDVLIRYGKYGAYIQIGRREDETKPEFRRLPPDMDPGLVTFDDISEIVANKPVSRELEGMPDGVTAVARTGPLGPYLVVTKEDGSRLNVDLQGNDPRTVTAETAISLIEDASSGKRNLNVINDFDGIMVLRGRYGPYVTDGKINATIPKTIDPESLDEEQSRKILENKKSGGGRQQKNIIRELDDGLKILDGRYGPYVTDGKVNASLPKDSDPSSFDLQACKDLLESKKTQSKRGGRKR